jgi:hypothetical protein
MAQLQELDKARLTVIVAAHSPVESRKLRWRQAADILISDILNLPR